MNVTSKLENLLGLSQIQTSIGSCLQLRSGVKFQHDDEHDSETIRWPERDYWIVSRELLVYRQLDLSGIPRNLRNKVLAQKVRRLSPFKKPDWYVFYEQDYAMVWIWDEDLRVSSVKEISSMFSALSEHLQGLEVIPEPLLIDRSSEGVHERRCFSGTDIQTWEEGCLVESCWQPADDKVALNWSEGSAWLNDTSNSLWSSEPFWWRAGVASLLLVLVFQLGSLAGWAFHNSRLKAEIADSRLQFDNILGARSEARELLRLNRELAKWQPSYSQLSLLADFDELMPASVEIREWDFHDDSLSVTVAAVELDNTSYIQQLNRGANFKNVSVTPGVAAGTAVLNMEVSQ